MEAMGAMALLPICDSSFTCEDYNTYRAHPGSPFPLRRAHPGPGPHTQRSALTPLTILSTRCAQPPPPPLTYIKPTYPHFAQAKHRDRSTSYPPHGKFDPRPQLITSALQSDNRVQIGPIARATCPIAVGQQAPLQ